MNMDASSGHARSGIVIALVVVGMLMLGAGGYLAWSKRHGGESAGSEEAARWCQIRQEWQKQADPLAADIMLKSVKDEDRPAMEQLMLKRNKLGTDYGRRIVELGITEQAIANVEAALVKEGKARANFAVEIHNALVKDGDSDDVTALGKTLALVRDDLATRIAQAKAAADREVTTGLAAAGATCAGLYRGPATDAGTSDSPYITWDEIDMRRAHAQKVIEDKLKQLEPIQEFTNRVYHELIRQYRPLLMGCYKKAKAKDRAMESTLGLQVRLKPTGEVKTLGIADNQAEAFLDCLLEKASKWKLPRPDAKTKMVVVPLDFTKI